MQASAVLVDSYDIEGLREAEGTRLGLIDLVPRIDPNSITEMTILESWKDFLSGKGVPWAVVKTGNKGLTLWKPRVVAAI